MALLLYKGRITPCFSNKWFFDLVNEREMGKNQLFPKNFKIMLDKLG